MISLAILKQMASENVANLVIDKNAFWEEAPLQKDGAPAQGVWFITRGGSAQNSPKGLNLHSTVDIFVALANKPKTEKVHQDILSWLLKNPTFCELAGSVGGVDYDFTNVRIRPTTTPQNSAITQNHLIVKVVSVNIIYDLKNN